MLIPAAQGLPRFARELGACVMILSFGPKSAEEREQTTDSTEHISRGLSRNVGLGPEITPKTPLLGLLSVERLGPQEREQLLSTGSLYATYLHEYEQYRRKKEATQNAEEKKDIENLWKKRLIFFAQPVQNFSLQQKLKFISAALLDFNRQGGPTKFPDPMQNEAYRIASMLNLSSRLSYQSAPDTVTKKRLVKEHFVVSYVYSLLTGDAQVGIFRDEILSMFPEMIKKHPELALSATTRSAYEAKVLVGANTHRQAWDLYIPKVDETILNYLLTQPAVSVLLDP